VTTFSLTLLAGLAVLALWRYLQKGLDRVDPWVARSLPDAASSVRTFARPRPGDLEDVGLAAIGGIGWLIGKVAVGGWSGAWIVAVYVGAWAVSGLVYRRSTLAWLVVLVAFCAGEAAYAGIRKGLGADFIAFSALAAGALLLLSTILARTARQRKAHQGGEGRRC